MSASLLEVSVVSINDTEFTPELRVSFSGFENAAMSALLTKSMIDKTDTIFSSRSVVY